MLRCLILMFVAGCCVASSAVHAAPDPFVPQSFTAISESEYWVLGSGGVLQTTDDGAHFTRLPAPPLGGQPGVVPVLRFVDRNDGYAYVPRGSLAVTRDGGHTWRRLHFGPVLAFATGGGLVHVVVARCTEASCGSYRLLTASVDGGAWRSGRLPFSVAQPLVGLAAHGRDVWLLGTVGNKQYAHAELARSWDGGATWHVGPSPCFAGLGGELQPVSSTVVWAVCPGGMMAQAWRSTDGGASFASLRTEMVNSAQLAPASADVAVLARNGAGFHPLRTVDGGRTWQRVHVPTLPTDVQWAGFTDARDGAAIVQTPRGTQLWRTADAGASWSLVRLP